MIFVAYIPRALGNLINATVTLPESVVRFKGDGIFHYYCPCENCMANGICIWIVASPRLSSR